MAIYAPSSETNVLTNVVEHITALAGHGEEPLTTEQRDLVEMAYGMLNAYLRRKGVATAGPQLGDLQSGRAARAGSMRAFAITSGDIERCPMRRLDVSHYRDDGTCLCVADALSEARREAISERSSIELVGAVRGALMVLDDLLDPDRDPDGLAMASLEDGPTDALEEAQPALAELAGRLQAAEGQARYEAGPA